MRRLRRLLHKSEAERRLDQELRFHLEQQTAAYVQAGMSPEEARRRSMLDFGGIEQVKEEVRETHWENRAELLFHDFRYAYRVLRKDFRFSLTAIATLAVGIAAATAMFSVVYNLWFDPFPYKDSDRLMVISIHDVKEGANSDHDRQSFTIPEFLAYREQNRSFEDLVGSDGAVVIFRDDHGSRRIGASYVTTNTFDFYGVAPLIGRGIEAADGVPGAAPVFVMNYKTWKSEFNSDATMVGKTYFVDGKQRTLVGIMPPRFQAYGGRLWLPLSLSIPRTESERRSRTLWTIGRRKAGITTGAAAADIEQIAKRLATQYPADYPPPERLRVSSQGLAQMLVGRFQVMLYALLGAVAMLLFIACGNVANLLLVKATTREQELAVRISLGASPTRLIRQLMAESAVLAGAAGMVGCALAYVAVRVIAANFPLNTLPDETEIRLSPNVLLFSVALSLSVALICGLTPAIHAVRTNLQRYLTGSSQVISRDVPHGRLRGALVVVEVAISVVLLVGTGLLTRSFIALTRVDVGFDPRLVLVALFAAPQDRHETLEDQNRFFAALLPRVTALPGVTSASVAYSLPPIWGRASDVTLRGKRHVEHWWTRMELCGANYFETLGLPLQRGRLLSESDIMAKRRVAVVSETLARKFFGNEEALGQTIKFNAFDDMPQAPHDAYFEIVGVVKDISNIGVRDAPIPAAYLPYTIAFSDNRVIFARTQHPSEQLLASIRREIWALDSGIAISDLGTLQGFLAEDSYPQPRFNVVMSGAFASVGLILVVLGVFSVMAYTVSLRTHEIGVRIALGAARATIVRMVLRKALGLIGFGVVIGVAASLAMIQLIAAQVWGVSVHDPWTFATAVLAVVLAGIGACLFPAIRAAKLDPLQALRYE